MTDYYVVVFFDNLKQPFFVSLMTDREEAFKAAKGMPGGVPIHIRGELIVEEPPK